MKNKLQKGFTLIELLVVIAIIGILASVVLTSVQSARVGARESSVKSALGQVRVSQEVYYNDSGTYGAPATVAPNSVDQIEENAGTGTIKGGGNTAQYAVAVDFPVDFDSEAWCVDSSGRNGEISQADWDGMGAADTQCP